eukprot:Selendium_serpulae@DN6265_c0_g1_i8.p2
MPINAAKRSSKKAPCFLNSESGVHKQNLVIAQAVVRPILRQPRCRYARHRVDCHAAALGQQPVPADPLGAKGTAHKHGGNRILESVYNFTNCCLVRAAFGVQ